MKVVDLNDPLQCQRAILDKQQEIQGLQAANTRLRTVMSEELQALKLWRKAEIADDVRLGMDISIDKIKATLKDLQ